MNEKSKESLEEGVYQIQQALYHIHSMSNLLEVKYREGVETGQIIDRDGDSVSSPLITIAEVIAEKSVHCLQKLEELGLGRQI